MTPTLEEWGLVPDDWVSPEEAAEFLDVDLDTLRRARRRTTGPVHRVWGQTTVRYRAGSLPDWQGRLASRKGIPTPEGRKVSGMG